MLGDSIIAKSEVLAKQQCDRVRAFRLAFIPPTDGIEKQLTDLQADVAKFESELAALEAKAADLMKRIEAGK